MGKILNLVFAAALAFATFEPASAQQKAVKDKSAPASGVTMAGYQRLKQGMKYDPVVKILGKEGTEVSSGGARTGLFSKVKIVMYQWFAGDGRANIIVTFKNGKLTSKAQAGLK